MTLWDERMATLCLVLASLVFFLSLLRFLHNNFRKVSHVVWRLRKGWHNERVDGLVWLLAWIPQ